MRVSRDISLMASGIFGAEDVTSDRLRTMVLSVASKENADTDLLAGLLDAYHAALVEEADSFEFNLETLEASEAGNLYRKATIAGFRALAKALSLGIENREDGEVYESCEWFEFDSSLRFTKQMIIDLGWLNGEKGAYLTRDLRAYHSEMAEV